MKTLTLTTIILIAMVGTVMSQIKVQYPPAWIKVIPQDEVYDYYRGDAIEANLEEAKQKARSDVYIKIQFRSTNIKPRTEGHEFGGTNGLHSEAHSSQGGEATLHASEADNMDVIGEFTEVDYSRFNPAYHCYILVRTPKSTGLVSKVISGIGGRADAVIHSAIFPGWGQIRQGRTGSGAFYMTAATVTGLSAATLFVLGNENVEVNGGVPHWRTYQKASMYALGGIYVANLVDALVFGKEPKEVARVEFSPLPTGAMLTMRF